MNIYETDSEFIERFEYFVEEVKQETTAKLPMTTRWMAILATLIGCMGSDTFEMVLPKALSDGVTPIEVKEIVYQATDYLGLGRTYPFINKVNEVFKREGIALPLPSQATTIYENRLEKGIQAQVHIFGEGMNDAWKKGRVNRWLASNCFGDYYTRKGLSLAQREMITFCFLMAQGGCEPQLIAHAKGNMNIGNDADFLQRIVAQCIPFIGYPRSLNALSAIEKALAQ